MAVATALVGNGWAKEMVPNDVLGRELYDSGVMMERIMMRKEVRDDPDSMAWNTSIANSLPGKVG